MLIQIVAETVEAKLQLELVYYWYISKPKIIIDNLTGKYSTTIMEYMNLCRNIENQEDQEQLLKRQIFIGAREKKIKVVYIIQY